MKLLNKSFNAYVQDTKLGIGILLVVSVVRFLLKPVFGVAYADGTNFASVTIFLPVIMLFYAVKVSRSGGSYRDLLGVAVALAVSTAVFIILGIAVGSFAGIDTYYTDPAHGGDLNPFVHMLGHVFVNGVVFSLVLWGIGSLVRLILGGGKQKAVA